MGLLFVFTENNVFGGGNRYLVDLVNAVSEFYDHVIIGSNAGGLYPDDLERLESTSSLVAVKFLTISKVAQKLVNFPKLLRRLFLAPFLLVDPVIFAGNILIFLKLLAKIKPDVVLCCNGGYPAARSVLAMAVAARLYRIKVAISIVSMPSLRPIWTKFYDLLIDKLVWNCADTVIVNAHSILQSLEKIRGLPAHKARVIHNCIEDNISPSLNKVKNDSLVIGCIARMDVQKGVIHLLDAFILLTEKYPSVRMLLAGEGNASKEMEHRVCLKGLNEKVRLVGHYRGDVDELLRALDIYVFPSLWEGFPYSIIEAMRAGCAIVATNVGGIPEALTHGKEGILVSPGSTVELLEAMEQLIRDKDLRKNLAQNARKRYENEFSLNIMHEQVRKVFRQTGLINDLSDVSSKTQEHKL